MIQKNTYLVPADKNGVLLVKTFHLYKGSSGRVAYTGDFVKISVRKTRPKNWISKKTKTRGIIIRVKKKIQKIDGSCFRFTVNNIVLLKKRMNPFGKRLIGPISKSICRRKFINSFSGII